MFSPQRATRPVLGAAALILCILVLTYITLVSDYTVPWRIKPVDMPSSHADKQIEIPAVTPPPSTESGVKTPTETNVSEYPEPDVPTSGDKIIVIGRLQSQDTSWLQEHLPDWQNAIYTVDNTSAPLSTARNKGREANPYLLYIIQNYHRLPRTIAFLHYHRDGWPQGWHNDASGYDNVRAMNSLNLDFVQRNGYANLRCNWTPGCPEEIQYLRSTEDFDPGNVEHQLPGMWNLLFGDLGAVPETLATPCCAQFAVSREQVLKRPLEDYKRYHQWLMDTPLSDAVSGRLFEYLWHVIFGMDPVYCPDMVQCYQDVYGR